MTKSISPKYIILYADDDEDDKQLLEESFSNYASNVEMILFNNGSETISYLESLETFEPSPCLIILDINMPILNGKEALQKIRTLNRFSETPVVLFSTSSQPQDKKFAESYNAFFLTKPIESFQMVMIAEMLMDHCSDEVKKNIRRLP